MKTITRSNKLILWALMLIMITLVFGAATSLTYASSTGTVTTTALNIRSGPGTGYTSLGLLSINKQVEINQTLTGDDGNVWYYITYGSVNGYVSARFIDINSDAEYVYDEAFESQLTAQGFPESYMPFLRQLHAQYPQWIFKASVTGLNWSDVIDRESTPGTTLVASSSISSWKSMEKGAYNFNTNSYVQYDTGSWVTASRGLIEYYMDPRNFINSSGVFQFLTHGFDGETQTTEGLSKILEGTFMSGAFPENGYETYAQVLMKAGAETGVNPYVLASMIIVEQGSGGTGNCISGKVSEYEGFYNFFNIGAYKTNTMSAVTRGLWYASQSGSYERPWNSRYKSILGGAQFYSANYVQNSKNTLYFKKFNVMNGAESVGIGQYMTNVEGAQSEAAALRKGYLSVLDSPMTFEIPVYANMPENPCIQPSSGNNNNFLSSLTVDGFTLTPEFDRYTYRYELVADKSIDTVNITACASSSSASISGGGEVYLNGDTTDAIITVTSSSGEKKNYTIVISKALGGQEGEQESRPSINSPYEFGEYVRGIDLNTSINNFIENVNISNGSMSLMNSLGKKVTSGYVGTGMKAVLYDGAGKVVSEYTIVIKGDINGDGKLNSADPLSLQKHIVGSKTISGAYLQAADINADTRTNSLDVLYMQKNIVGSYTIKN